jgi:Glycosyltransferase WbsX
MSDLNRPQTTNHAGVRPVALHLPQFHPIAENDAWWGKGFTEWTNTGKAKPLFRGHRQPNVPADLGYYDLRLPEARRAQADLARQYGIEAFCYYHYWFGGRRLLEKPVEDILAGGEPDFPFCLCWANETWTGIWHASPDKVLVKQTYPGEADYEAHFNYLLKAFRDPRYLTVDGRPVFAIYRGWDVPNVKAVLELWNKLAARAGLPPPFYIAMRNGNRTWNARAHGFDGTVTPRLPKLLWSGASASRWHKLLHAWDQARGRPTIYDYSHSMRQALIDSGPGENDYPCVIPNWDNTPRSGANGLVLRGASPETFRPHLRQGLQMATQHEGEQKFLFIKAWNEWAEGNYLEPDQTFGRGYLEVMRQELQRLGA